MADTERGNGLAYVRRRLEALNLPEMTVRCRDREWKVHHFILGMHDCFEGILEVESDVSKIIFSGIRQS